MQKLKAFFKSEIVLIIASVAALATCFFVPLSVAYIEYIDFAVLAILFCLMLVVAGFIKENLFGVLNEKLFSRIKSSRILFLILMLICFFSAMVVTNDVALLTFVPLAIFLVGTNNKKDLVFVIVMQTVAANLGSMLTPIGNPQNLYLFRYYNLSLSIFLKTVFPFAIVSLVLLVLPFFVIKNKPFAIPKISSQHILSKRFYLYIILFIICILTVLRVVDTFACLLVCSVLVLVFDNKLFAKVDYGLIFTFVAFFIFVGNLANIPIVTTFISSIIKNAEILSAILLSQVISNVPTAVMLSGFTDNVSALLIGTNIGGLGSIVASLASLIAYKLYAKSHGSDTKHFLYTFTIVNACCLSVLLLFALIG